VAVSSSPSDPSRRATPIRETIRDAEQLHGPDAYDWGSDCLLGAGMGVVALGIFTTSVNAGGPALEGGLLCGGPVGPRSRRLAHITEHCFNHPSVSLGFGWTDLLTWRRNENVGFGTSLATALRYGSSETGRKQTMAQDLIFWVSTASVCMGMGVLFAISVALKQLAADDDPD
jgi:hypothetical protein